MDPDSRMSAVDDMLLANERYARSHEPVGGIGTMLGVTILTCMDASVNPNAIFGLEPGDAHILRNAGGRVSSDALRSIAISNNLAGTREIVVMHHTGCSMSTDHDVLRRQIQEISGADTSSLDLMTIKDLERSVREDVARVLGSPFTPDDVRVWGFVYDVATGHVRQVFPG